MCTVAELREQLQDLEDMGHGDLDVVFAYHYGDHWNTQVAADVDEATAGVVSYSDYHQMNRVEEMGSDTEHTRKVIILN